MKGLFIDFETNGVEPQKDEITECGFLIGDVQNKIPLRCENVLVQHERPIPANIITLTGCNFADYKEHAINRKVLSIFLLSEISKVDFLVAHNAEFERGFLKELFEWHIRDIEANKNDASTIKKQYQDYQSKHWIDTQYDLPLPERCTSKGLESLTFKHNLINYYQHRALFDALAMFQLFCMYDFGAILESSKSPLLLLTAQVSFDNKDLAKEAGFAWIPERKAWELKIKQCDYEKTKFPFQCIKRTV